MKNERYAVEDATLKANNNRLLRILLTTLNTICHILVVYVITYIAAYAGYLSNILDSINLHVLLCTIGYAFFMTEAIISINDENVWSRHLSRRSRAHVHWVLQVVGAICGISGVVIKYVANERRGKRHFTSVHSLCGVASVAGVIAIGFTGLAALFAARISQFVRPVIVKFVHNILAITCFIVGMCALIVGYDKSRYFRQTYALMHQMCIIATYCIVVLALHVAVRSLIRQIFNIVKT